MADPDDEIEEGLRWDGDPADTAAPRVVHVAPVADEGAEPVEQMSSSLLVTYGIIAGIYLLYTVGWIIAATRTSSGSADILVQIMFQLGQFLAIAAAPLWFVTVFTLTRARKPLVRLLWLVLGLLLFVPLPFILGGGA
jgi:hypothetical protein